jgi:4-amino-4-deoxy-L-arabinose transferase-like glycosyltransferase
MSRINSTGGKYATLFFGCVIFHIIGTWSLPLIDRDEPRFAEASREMIQRADYVVPYFNNQLRLDKPPLTYWAQVATYRIFGESDFSARFPSAIAAALIALVISAWGRRNDNAQVSWWAAIVFTLCLQTFLHAKAAVADMWLVLFMTTAHWAGYELLQRPTLNADRPTPDSAKTIQTSTIKHQTSLLWWLTFYLSLALGFLAKGPIAWIPLLTVAVALILARDRRLARHFKFIRGILLMLAVVALWGTPALIRTNGEFFAIGIGRHVISRSLATMEGHGASSFGMYLLLLPFYFITIFVSFFPWSIKLPWLVRKLWIQKQDAITDSSYSGKVIDKYLITGIAIIFVIFTLVATKLPHYTLPAFP